MSDQQESLRNDIAFLRALAEEGRRGEAAGGSIVASAGLIFGTASLATWWASAAHSPLAASGFFFSAVWYGSTALYLILLVVLKARRPAAAGPGRASGLAWAGAGWALFVIILSLTLIAYRSHAWWLLGAVSPVVLAIYGSAWMVAGLLAGRAWLRAVGLGSYAMALVCAWFAIDLQVLFGVYALALFALVAAPGLVLMRQERRA